MNSRGGLAVKWRPKFEGWTDWKELDIDFHNTLAPKDMGSDLFFFSLFFIFIKHPADVFFYNPSKTGLHQVSDKND